MDTKIPHTNTLKSRNKQLCPWGRSFFYRKSNRARNTTPKEKMLHVNVKIDINWYKKGKKKKADLGECVCKSPKDLQLMKTKSHRNSCSFYFCELKESHVLSKSMKKSFLQYLFTKVHSYVFCFPTHTYTHTQKWNIFRFYSLWELC